MAPPEQPSGKGTSAETAASLVADDDAGGIHLVGDGGELGRRPSAAHLERPVDPCAGHDELAVEMAQPGRLGLGEEERRGAGLGHRGLALDVHAQDPAPGDDCKREDVREDLDPTDAVDADHHHGRSDQPGVVVG